MCGRFAITLPPEAMRRLFGYDDRPNFPPRYNIAPTQPIPLVRVERGDIGAIRRFSLARWAFMPSFMKDPKDFPLIFNARSEGIAERASFRNAIRRRRCLIPADCFYEWQRGGGRPAPSRPYLVKRADSQPMAFAGLWETWNGPNGEEVDTACIITTAANGVTAAIHPRLPAIIAEPSFDLWLDLDDTCTDAAVALLQPAPDDLLVLQPIGEAVNSVANDGPEVQRPRVTVPGDGSPAPEQFSLF